MRPFDLTTLPQPQIIEPIEFESILKALRDDLVSRFPILADVIDFETEPAQMLLQAFAYREVILRARINDAAKANLLAFAMGSDLDHLASFYDVERLTGEQDADLRRRTVLAIQGRSTGGPAARYRFVALSADVDVADAIVWVESTSPQVNVAILSHSGEGLASPELLAKITAVLNAPDVRVVSDHIAVVPAIKSRVNITADVWLLPGQPSSLKASLETALRTAWANESRLGFDLMRSWIIAKLMQPGVQKVEVSEPLIDQLASPYETFSIGSVALRLL